MGINTVPQPPYSLDRAPCDFWLFPKLRGCRYETIEEMKEAVTKVIDTLTQEDFHGASQRLLERYNKCITAGGDYQRDMMMMCINKSALTTKSLETYLMILVYMYLLISLIKQDVTQSQFLSEVKTGFPSSTLVAVSKLRSPVSSTVYSQLERE